MRGQPAHALGADTNSELVLGPGHQLSLSAVHNADCDGKIISTVR